MNSQDQHPWWCGAHPSRNLTTDWCRECDDEADFDEVCFKEHPNSIMHKREIRFPFPIRKSDDDNLWFSARHNEANPRLWFSDRGTDESEAREIPGQDSLELAEDFADFLKIFKH